MAVSIADASSTKEALETIASQNNPYELPYVFGPNTTIGLENLTQNQLKDFYKNSKDLHDMPPINDRSQISGIALGKVEPYNPVVISRAHQIVAGRSGDLTIDQICAIYDFMRYGRGNISSWIYVSENLEIVHYANETIIQGERDHVSGEGDCDDFAVVMASLILSINGTARIIKTGDRHVYAEVYLGNMETNPCEMYHIIEWMMLKYRTNKIYVHIDPSNKDLWLNLDTPLSLGERAYPGLPFAHSNIPDAIVWDPSVNKSAVKEVEYDSLMDIINESMYSPEGNRLLSVVDEMIIISSLLGIPRENLTKGLKESTILKGFNGTMNAAANSGILPFSTENINPFAFLDISSSEGRSSKAKTNDCPPIRPSPSTNAGSTTKGSQTLEAIFRLFMNS